MSEYMIGQPIDWQIGSQFLDRWNSDDSDDIDCAPTKNRVRRDPTILELAARLNAASNRYHEAAQSRRMSFSDRLARVDKLVAAADELTSAIADAVAAGDGRLT